MADNSGVGGGIWPKSELIQAFMHVLLTCKNEDDRFKKMKELECLRKTKTYNTNVDLVDDNVYTKFGLNRSIRSQEIEQKPNSDANQGP